MQIQVKQKNIPISLKKAQLFLPNLRGKKTEEALSILKFSNKKVAYYLEKLLENAIAAASEKNLDEKKLYLKSLKVDRGPYLRRIQYRARGRADMINKPRSHFSLVLAEKPTPESKSKSNVNKNKSSKSRRKK